MTRSEINSTNRRTSLAQKLVNTLEMKFDEESETNRLEAEIAEEETPVSQSRLSRFRRRGAMILYSKYVLMVIVLLNAVDCLLVTGELILDVHYIKEILEESDLESQRFVDQMQLRYPDHLSGHDIDHMGVFHNALYRAKCYWDEDPTAICGNTNQIRKLLEADDTQHGDDNLTNQTDMHAHGPWEHVAHGLHKASIVILGVLFLENVTKIFCVGRRFLHRKIEVFDAIIVCASFVLDIVFLRGIIIYRVQDGVLILSFLLPWRVIRVVNSLKLHGILSLLQENIDEGMTILSMSKYPSADKVMELFAPTFSKNQEEKEIEELIIYHWNIFLKNVERGNISTNWLDLSEGEDITESIVTMNMGHVLQALIGCRRLPTNMMKGAGTIEFDHIQSRLTTANTCAPSLFCFHEIVAGLSGTRKSHNSYHHRN